MKKIIIGILLCLSVLPAICQEKAETVNQRYLDAKIREFVYRLELTDKQRDAFIPIYKRYNSDMHTSVGHIKTNRDRPATSGDAAVRVKEHIKCQQKAQDVRLKYVDEFASVLNPEQLIRLFEVENQIQHKLMSYKNGQKGPRGQYERCATPCRSQRPR